MSIHDHHPDARMNFTTDEGWECPRCGSDHAPRVGICGSCRRRTREALNVMAKRTAMVLRAKEQSR